MLRARTHRLNADGYAAGIQQEAPVWTVAVALAAPVGIGDLVLDPARWRVEGTDDAVTVHPIEGGEGTSIRLLPVGTACPPDPAASSADHDGLAIRVVVRDLGCRNSRPPAVSACVAFRGREYQVVSSVLGCKGGPGSGAETPRLLADLRPRP